MCSRFLLVVAVAVFGGNAALVSSAPALGFNNVGYGASCGTTVAETLVTPYHRTDSVIGPCGHRVVQTTAIPIAAVPYATGAGFLSGTAGGVYPNAIGGYLGGATGGYMGAVGAFHGGALGGIGGSFVGNAGLLNGGVGGFVGNGLNVI